MMAASADAGLSWAFSADFLACFATTSASVAGLLARLAIEAQAFEHAAQMAGDAGEGLHVDTRVALDHPAFENFELHFEAGNTANELLRRLREVLRASQILGVQEAQVPETSGQRRTSVVLADEHASTVRHPGAGSRRGSDELLTSGGHSSLPSRGWKWRDRGSPLNGAKLKPQTHFYVLPLNVGRSVVAVNALRMLAVSGCEALT